MSEIELNRLKRKVVRGSFVLSVLLGFVLALALSHFFTAIGLSVSPILLICIPILILVGLSLIRNQSKLNKLKKVSN